MKKSGAPSSSSSPPPPRHLSAEARRLWREVIAGYSIGADDAAGLLLLATALEAFDRMRQAQRVIKRDGPMLKDRFGQKRTHPALLWERDARSQMILALKELHLDIEPLAHAGPGRPGGR